MILAWYTRKTRKSWCKQLGGCSDENLQHSADIFSRLSFVKGGRYSFYDQCRRRISVILNYVYFFSVQISENCTLFRNHGSSLPLWWLQESFPDDSLDIWITRSIVITKWAYPKGYQIIKDIKLSNSFGRRPIEARKQIAVAVWALSNQETCRQLSDRFDITMSIVSRCNGRVVRALVDVRTDLIQWPRGNIVILAFMLRKNHRRSKMHACRDYDVV